MKTLRDYQRRAIEQGIYGYFEEHKGNPLIVLPTGTGKSLVIAEFIREVMEIWPDQRIIVLAHVKELIEQNYLELMEQAPTIDAGIYSAGLKRRDTDTKVLFAGIQSVYKRAYELGMFDLALIDEAHTVPHEGEGQYRTFFKDARRANPLLKSIGFTATPFRLSQGLLTEGEGALFSDISYDGTEELLDMIAQGYLCPVRTKGVKTKYDLSGLHVRGGEYVASELEAAMDVDDLTEAALNEVIQHGEDRKSWLIFASSVAHAWHIKESLVLKGITAAVVTGETAQEDRDAIIRAYKAGDIRAIVNMGVLTTGFNHPSIDLLVLLRKTKSTGLYVQMIGRGMRVADGKSDCVAEGSLVLTDHGLVPIEKVTYNMRLWDGVTWVTHGGTVYKGEQEVIDYAGITATPDHKVWTRKGWKCIEDCAREQLPIAVTGKGSSTVKLSDCHYRGGNYPYGEEQKETFFNNTLRNVWNSVNKRLLECLPGFRWVSQMWKTTQHEQAGIRCSGMAYQTLYCCQKSLYKSKKCKISFLRWARNFIQIQKPERYGTMGYGSFRNSASSSNRQNRQQWTLRTWKSTLINQFAELFTHKETTDSSIIPSVSDALSTYSLCGQHITQAPVARADRRRNSCPFQGSVHETKRRVWDILNAGPLHRFTCEGLLVSNCLVLDFGENIQEHGPIDTIRPRSKAKGDNGGTAPVRECPGCATVLHISITVCPECGHVFPLPEPKIVERASSAPILSSQVLIETFPIDNVSYSRHEKPGKTPSLRIDYHTGYKRVASEWICLEHVGYAREKAEKIWYERTGRAAPDTVEEGLEQAPLYMKEPTEITVNLSGDFPRITNFTYSLEVPAVGWRHDSRSTAKARDFDDDVPF